MNSREQDERRKAIGSFDNGATSRKQPTGNQAAACEFRDGAFDHSPSPTPFALQSAGRNTTLRRSMIAPPTFILRLHRERLLSLRPKSTVPITRSIKF